LLRARPAIADPDRHTTAVDDRRRLFPVNQKLARLLRGALNHPDPAHGPIDIAIDQLIALELDRGIVVVELGLPIAEFAVPITSFTGLETILVADQHQDTLIAELLELFLDLGAQLAVVDGKVVDEKISEVVLGGTYADVCAGFALQFADQER